MAFAIGAEKTHWVTYNRGDSWQSFEAPLEASLMGEVLSFHAEKEGWILYQGVTCEDTGGGKWGGGSTCWDQTYYTTDAFRTEPQLLLKQTSQCSFARSTAALKDAPEKLVFCVAFDQNVNPGNGGMRNYKDSLLYSSDDWFVNNKKFVDLGVGKRARGVVGLGVVSKFMVVALKAGDDGARRATGGDPMFVEILLQIIKLTLGTCTSRQMAWTGDKPNSLIRPCQICERSKCCDHSTNIDGSAYTIVESTTHSVAVDIIRRGYLLCPGTGRYESKLLWHCRFRTARWLRGTSGDPCHELISGRGYRQRGI